MTRLGLIALVLTFAPDVSGAQAGTAPSPAMSGDPGIVLAQAGRGRATLIPVVEIEVEGGAIGTAHYCTDHHQHIKNLAIQNAHTIRRERGGTPLNSSRITDFVVDPDSGCYVALAVTNCRIPQK